MTDVNIAITTGVGADNQLNRLSANNNLGIVIAYSIISGTRILMFRFDLSGIAAGQVCTAATLKLYHADTNGIDNTYKLYKITDANGDWVEGTKDNATAGDGEPCWNKKAYNTVNWAGSVGLETPGTDYINTSLAEVTTPGSITANAVLEIPFTAAGLTVLQSWFGAATNNGLLMLRTAGTTIGTFHSKEATTSGYRPVLAITHVDPSGHPAVNRMSQVKFVHGYGGR